jgi:hypothetical protein
VQRLRPRIIQSCVFLEIHVLEALYSRHSVICILRHKEDPGTAVGTEMPALLQGDALRFVSPDRSVACRTSQVPHEDAL